MININMKFCFFVNIKSKINVFLFYPKCYGEKYFFLISYFKKLQLVFNLAILVIFPLLDIETSGKEMGRFIKSDHNDDQASDLHMFFHIWISQ